MELYFPEITFEAAHYIPGHDKCGGIHGHTYFVRNLTIDVSMIPVNEDAEEGMTIDFGIIKSYFEGYWDHKFLVPPNWHENISLRDIKGNLKVLTHTTAEWIAIMIKDDLLTILNQELKGTPYETEPSMVHFELWEGPHQAVKV